MASEKAKFVVALLLLTGVLTVGMGAFAPPQRTEKQAKTPKTEKKGATRTDRFGDPLPPGAVARIGTVRFREGAEMFALAASPDGKLLASKGYGESVIRLWDAATGKQLFLLKTRLAEVGSLAFSPDGRWLAGGGPGAIHVWDVATHILLRILPAPKSAEYTVAFSPDSRRLAAKGRQDNTIRVWDLNSGKETLQFKSHQGTLYSFAFSPDGKCLATGSDDKAIILWDAATGKERRRFVDVGGPVGHSFPYVAFSPDSKVVAGGSSDGTIHLWDAGTGRERLTIPKHDKSAEYAIVVFSPDGKYLANRNPIGIVYDAATGKERCRLQNCHRWVPSLVFSPDGKTLVGDGLHRVRFWDAATGKELFKDTAHRDAVSSVVFSPDGQMLFTAGRDAFAGAWETATGRQRFRFQGQRRSHLKWHRNEVAVAPDGKTAAAWLAGELYSWDVRQPKPMREYSDPVAGYLSMNGRHGLAFSPQGRLLAAGWGWHDGLTRLWLKGMKKEPIVLKNNYKSPNSIKFSPDGKTLAFAGDDGTARLWDRVTGKELQTLPGVKEHHNPKGGFAIACSLAFSPDSKTLALGGSDGTIGLWDTISGRKLVPAVSSSIRNAVEVLALAYSPDGKTVAAGYRDGTVRFWETVTGKPRRAWATHTGSILSLAFSPDGKHLASAGSDTTVLIWTANPESKIGDLSTKEVEILWNDLAGDDGGKAYRAIGALRAASRRTVPLLKTHLRPVAAVDAKHLARLIADLDDARFTIREKASTQLTKYGDRAAPALRKILERKPPLEVRRRIEAILEQLDRPLSAERLREVRAVEALEQIGTLPAQEVLRTLAEGAPEAHLTREAKAALARLTYHSLAAP